LAVAAIVFGIKVLHSTPGAIGPGASPVAQLPSQPPAAPVTTSCRLAVSYVTSTGHPAKLAGAFLAYPGSGLSTTSFSVDTPAGSSSAAWTYDAPLHRWLPTLPGAVAPDGHAYIADLTSDSITVVDAMTGHGTQLVSGGVFRALGWGNQGIVYLAARGNSTSFNLLDPQSRASRVLAVPGFPAFYPGGRVNGNALWGVGLDSANASTVVRVDLASGQATVWYTFAAVPGSHNGLPQLLGFDRLGHPLVLNAPSGFNGAYQVVLLTGAQQASTIYTGQPSSGFRPAQNAIGDAHGIWMLGTDGSLWLYRTEAGLQAVSPAPGSPTIAALAGGCI